MGLRLSKSKDNTRGENIVECIEKIKKGFSFIQTAKLAESEGTLRASGMRPGSNPGPRAPKLVR